SAKWLLENINDDEVIAPELVDKIKELYPLFQELFTEHKDLIVKSVERHERLLVIIREYGKHSNDTPEHEELEKLKVLVVNTIKSSEKSTRIKELLGVDYISFGIVKSLYRWFNNPIRSQVMEGVMRQISQ
ncbi:hypothetical protein LR010_01370, partial [Candidatus Gracilibacteria bacterium]|nr:hypothetical protein [Candidatus Gracilibacteria bacterium]